MTNQVNAKWWIFFGAGLMIFLVNVDSTIVNLALAQIAKDLHSNLTQIQWVINAYLLTTAIFFIIGGKLSDNYGPRKIFLIGTVFFGIASLIAGLAPNIHILIFARLIQGIGFAFTLSLALLMIAQTFPPTQRGFALGLAITFTGLGQSLGPTMGGLILTKFSWHWIFLINLPITIISFTLIYIFGQRKERQPSKQMIDYFGAVFFGIIITILLLTFNLLNTTAINLPLFFSGIIITLILFVLFYYKELKSRNPLIDFHLFVNRTYSLSLIIRFLFMYIFGTFLFFVPLYLQNILGFSPLAAGLILLVYASMYGIFSPLAGRWSDQVGYRIPIIVASIISFIGFLLLAAITTASSIYLILLGMLAFGISAGPIISCTLSSALSSLPPKNSGEGIGMFFTIAFLGTSLGVAISGAQVNIISWHTFITSLSMLQLSLSPSQLDLLHHVTNGSQSLSAVKQYYSLTDISNFTPLIKNSFIKGFRSVMILNAVFLIIIIFLSAFFQKEGISQEKN